jgi:general secretion pathway protein G
MKKNNKGFTLIELLVVIAIIGLLSTLAVVSSNSARQKSRDAKRVADIKQIQTALELYYTEQSEYPETTGTAVALALGAGSGITESICSDGGSAAECDTISSDNGISDVAAGTTYMGSIPKDPTGTTECTGNPTGVCIWSYMTKASNDNEYCISFYLEGATGSLSAGAKAATQDGIIDDNCTALGF